MPPAVRRMSRAASRRPVPLLLVAVWLLGCPANDAGPTFPEPEVYATPSNFEGEWIGEVAGLPGTLKISALGGGRYYGLFRADDGSLQYSLKMNHIMADEASLQGEGSGSEEPRPTNLVEFAWQDGRGGQGMGWVLINREDSALTGAFGRGENNTEGLGEWTFIRFD